MAIFGHGYRQLRYEPTSIAVRLLPLAQLEFRNLFRTRWGFFAMLLCAVPSVLSLFVLMYQFGLWEFLPRGLERDLGGRLNPFNLHFYLDPIVDWSRLSFLLLTTLVSSRAVARDRASGGLELLWTRSITPWGYFVAKWSGSIALLGILFFVLPLVLWILGVFMADGWTLLERTWPFIPRFFLAMAVLVLVLSFIPTAFSVLTATPAFSSMLWIGSMLGSSMLAHELERLLGRDPRFRVIDPWEAGKRVVEWIVGIGRPDIPVGWAIGVLGLIVGSLAVCLVRRLRTVEAIGA